MSGGTRVPSSKLGGPGAPVLSADVEAQLKWLRSRPVLDGRLLDVKFPATPATTVSVPHGLNRRYVGAFVVCQDDTSKFISVASPGDDGTKLVSFGCSAATSMKFRAWVF